MSSASMLPTAAVAAMEAVLNRLVALDPEAATRLRALEGRSAAVEIRLDDADVAAFRPTLWLMPVAGGVRLMTRYEGEPDAVISGPPFSLLRLLSSDVRRSISDSEVSLHGDAEFAQRLREVLVGLDIDWEEHLSRYTGDIVAHQLGRTVRDLGRWGRQAFENLRSDMGDYVREEQAVAARPDDVQDWMSAIDTLREDVDRLAARVERLRRGKAQP